jgi:NADPH-dependent curcumin reductase
MSTTPGQTTQVRLAAYPDGEPQDSDFEIVTVDLPELQDGQVLLRSIYLSPDPYMRGRAPRTASPATSSSPSSAGRRTPSSTHGR